MGLSEFFKDDTNALSMKRLAFCFFCLLWACIMFLHFPEADLASCERMIVWLGGFILAEDVAPSISSSSTSGILFRPKAEV
jgi:hypothetical protein